MRAVNTPVISMLKSRWKYSSKSSLGIMPPVKNTAPSSQTRRARRSGRHILVREMWTNNFPSGLSQREMFAMSRS